MLWEINQKKQREHFVYVCVCKIINVKQMRIICKKNNRIFERNEGKKFSYENIQFSDILLRKG